MIDAHMFGGVTLKANDHVIATNVSLLMTIVHVLSHLSLVSGSELTQKVLYSASLAEYKKEKGTWLHVCMSCHNGEKHALMVPLLSRSVRDFGDILDKSCQVGVASGN